MASSIFLLSVIVIVGVYALYPAAIALLARSRPDVAAIRPATGRWPSITVVCAVYNESHRVAAKIQDLHAQGYPGALQVVFVCDGSTDTTEALLRADPRVQCLAYPDRRGKVHAVKAGVGIATGDLLVFADVRQSLVPGALEALVAPFSDAGVGAVSGMLVHAAAGGAQAQSIGLYWRYERAIRRAESRYYSTVGATGALYAIRRADFVGPPDGTILDDFEIPMAVVRAGKRVILAEAAVVVDELQADVSGERARKVRTLSGNYQSFARLGWLWSPATNPVFWQWLLHKVGRLVVPWAMLAALWSSALAEGAIFRTAFWLQVLFYAVALAGLAVPAIRRLPLVSVAVVFVELNRAAVLGLFNHLRRQEGARWEKTA